MSGRASMMPVVMPTSRALAMMMMGRRWVAVRSAMCGVVVRRAMWGVVVRRRRRLRVMWRAMEKMRGRRSGVGEFMRKVRSRMWRVVRWWRAVRCPQVVRMKGRRWKSSCYRCIGRRRTWVQVGLCGLFLAL